MQPDFNTLTPVATSQPDFNTLQPAGQIQTQPKSLSDSIWNGLVGGSQAVTDTLGLHGATDSLGSAIAAGTNPGLAEKGYLPVPSMEQGIGTGLQVGGAVAGLAAGQPGSLAESSALFGGLGAAQSGGAAMSNNADASTVAKKAFYGGLSGTAIGAAGYGLQKGLSTLADKAPDALYNNALNVASKVKAAGKSPAGFLADEGIWGSLGSMSHQIQSGASVENDAINSAVQSLDEAGDIPAPDYNQVKQDAVAFLADTKLGKLYSGSELAGLVDKVPLASLRDAESATSWGEFNDARKALGGYLGDAKWLQTTPTEQTQATKAVYGALSDAVKGATGTDENFSRLAQYTEANKAVGKALLAADKKWLPGFYDWTSGAVGSVLGMFGGNPVLGAAASVGLERAARSPVAQTGAAQLINAIPEIGGTLGRGAATAASSGAIANSQ